MTDVRPKLKLWLYGLVAFAIVIAVGIPLGIEQVPGGILDHQSAGTAERVDQIQAAWAAAGLRTTAIIAMAGDLIFIGIYGWGSYVAGRSFSHIGPGLLRAIGLLVMAAAIVFLITDYLETTLQIIQLLRDQGSDWMAGTAATARPIKAAAWIVTFVGVIAGYLTWKFSARAG